MPIHLHVPGKHDDGYDAENKFDTDEGELYGGHDELDLQHVRLPEEQVEAAKEGRDTDDDTQHHRQGALCQVTLLACKSHDKLTVM